MSAVGVTTSKWLLSSTVNERAGRLPKLTPSVPAKPLPVTTMESPPCQVPEPGLTEVIFGVVS